MGGFWTERVLKVLKFHNMKKVIGLMCGLVLIGAGCVALPSEPEVVQETVRVEGEITAVSNSCIVDGVCSVTIDDKYEVVLSGGMVADPRPRGTVGPGISSSSGPFGVKVEFYGAVADYGYYSLVGSEDYYLRLAE